MGGREGSAHTSPALTQAVRTQLKKLFKMLLDPPWGELHYFVEDTSLSIKCTSYYARKQSLSFLNGRAAYILRLALPDCGFAKPDGSQGSSIG